jgi:hypothetical protein
VARDRTPRISVFLPDIREPSLDVFPARGASPIGRTVSAPMMMAKLPSMRMNSIFRSNEE